MNALPRPPLYDLPPEEPVRRRRRWLRGTGWIFAAIGALIILLVVAAVVLLHNAAFHRYMLRTAQEKASAALGSQVLAKDFALHWSGISPTVDMYDVVVHGAPPYADPPLLQVNHIEIQVRITSLLRRTWYLNEVRVERPVVRVLVDKHGTDNLPQTKSKNQQSKTSVFDLGVRHAVLDQGEVYYNNRKSALDADLHDLNFQSGFNTAQTKYSGTLAYRNGHLRLGDFNPIEHDLDARFNATPKAFTLESATLRSGPSQIAMTATLEDYAQPKVRASYHATIDSGEFRRVMKNPSLPVGVIQAAGSLQYITEPNRPLMDTLTLNGDLSSSLLTVHTPSLRADIRDLGARYSLANGNVQVSDLRARLLGGELTGTMSIRNIAGAPRSNLRAALRGISLADLKPMMSSPSMKQVALGGTLNATAEAAWGTSMSDLVMRTDATLNGSLASASGGRPVPVNGIVHARYSAAAKEISLTQSYLRLPQTSVTLSGTVSDRSSLQVRMQSNDLHELETVADIFNKPSAGQAPQPLGLYGQASFAGAVSGSTSAPRVTGQLNASNLKLKGGAWKLLRTSVDASPSQFSLQNGDLQPADGGRIRFNLGAGLRHWAFTQESPFQAHLNASQVNVEDLTKLAGSTAPVSGTLNVNISVHGSELNPIGQGTLSLTNAKVSGEPVQSLNVHFNGTGDRVNANLSLHMPAGTASATLAYFPKQKGYDGQLRATGIHLDQLQAVKAKNLQLTGVLNLIASGRGTLQNPELQARAEIPRLDIRGQTLSGLTLQAAVANHLANFSLDSNVVNTYARARGSVALTGNYYANATVDTQAIPLAPLVAAYAPAQAGNITGQTEIHGTLRGPLKNKSLLEAHVIIPQLAVNYKNIVQLAEIAPIHIDFANGVLNVEPSGIRGTDTDLRFQGTVPVNSSAPASLLLAGTVDLRLAQLLNPDIESSGQLRFDINSYGRRTDPNVQGRVEIVNANFASGSLPLGMQNGNGVLTLTKDRLNITSFTGTVGSGTVTATGGVTYRPALRFDVGMAANGVRLLYPGGVRAGFDAQLALTGAPDDSLLRGQVRVGQLQFTPDFDLMNFMGQFSGEATPPQTQGFSNDLRLDVGVQSSSGISLVSRTLSVQGAANLRVNGTAAQPVILGRVNLTGGDLIFMGNRYLLQGGTIDFINPSRTDPVVNVAVNTTVQQYNIQMRFWGPADHLHTNYSSDPALPPSDIINLIAFGKTTEAAAANPMPPGNLGAESLVASQVSSQVTNRVEKLAGISQLSIDPVLGGGEQNPGARVAVQQRVTSKIFVTFATDVTSTQRQVIKLEYQATPRLSISGTRDQNGGFAVDTRIRKNW